jgi:hypothetical protein
MRVVGVDFDDCAHTAGFDFLRPGFLESVAR